GFAPHDLDHPRRAGRVGGAADGVDGRIVGFQQALALDYRDLGAVLLGDLAGDALDLPWAHVVGRGVDHVAGQGAGVRHLAHLRDVGAVGQQPGALAAVPGRLVAVEPVAPQRPGQRDAVGPDALWLLGNAIDTGGKPRRQPA